MVGRGGGEGHKGIPRLDGGYPGWMVVTPVRVLRRGLRVWHLIPLICWVAGVEVLEVLLCHLGNINNIQNIHTLNPIK